MTEKINHFLCSRIIQHIKSCDEITFDTADLEEFGIEKIIGSYGWYPILNKKEEEIIFNDLFDLALRHETAEVAGLTCRDILPKQDIDLLFARTELSLDAEAVLAGC